MSKRQKKAYEPSVVYCDKHPAFAWDARGNCEECVRLGYTFRIGSHRIGGKTLLTITVPVQEAK